jgi:hypothetical protein
MAPLRMANLRRFILNHQFAAWTFHWLIPSSARSPQQNEQQDQEEKQPSL